MFVRLKAGWPGNFRRSVKDSAGETLTILEWSPEDKTPMEVTDPMELAAIKNDIGKSLEVVNPPVAVAEKMTAPTTAAAIKPPKKPQVADAPNPLQV